MAKGVTATDWMKSNLENWNGQTRVWTPAKMEGYNPKTVTGELLRVEEWDTEHGETRVAIILDDFDAQETAIYANSLMLATAWTDKMPSIGDRIGVAFGGQQEGKNGRVYNRYKLLVERCQANGQIAPVDQGDPFAE